MSDSNSAFDGSINVHQSLSSCLLSSFFVLNFVFLWGGAEDRKKWGAVPYFQPLVVKVSEIHRLDISVYNAMKN